MEEWAKLLVETWQSMDFGRLEPYFAEDAVYAAGGPARGSKYEGKAAVMGAMGRAVHQVFEIDKIEVKKVITAKDHVILSIYDEGKSRLTGRPYANELLFMYEIRDGKIKQQREYLDTIASARATGDLPYPD